MTLHLSRRSALTLAGFGLLGAAGLTACGSSSSGSTGSANTTVVENKNPVTVPFGLLKGVSPVFIGMERGYFQEEGITVDLQWMKSGSDLMPLVASDKLLAGVSSPAAGFFNALGRGINTRIVADSGRYLDEKHAFGGMVVRKDLADSGVSKVADLKGKKIAITAEGSAMQLLALKAIEQAGLTPQDVQLVTMDFPTMVTSLTSKEVDAVMVSEPFVTQSVAKGPGKILIGADKINPDGQQIVMVYSPKMMKNADGVGDRFMRGWIRSVRDYIKAYDAGGAEREAVDKIQGKHLEMDPAALSKTIPLGLDKNGALNEKDLQDRQESWQKLKQVDQVVPLAEYVDNSFRERAAQKLGG